MPSTAGGLAARPLAGAQPDLGKPIAPSGGVNVANTEPTMGYAPVTGVEMHPAVHGGPPDRVPPGSVSLPRRAWAANRPLALVGTAMIFVLAATLVGLLVDDHAITGAPAWLKPAKFAVSVAVYSFTFVWLLGFVEGHRRLVAVVSWGTALFFAVEMVAIVGQAARGTTSHFNVATAFDGAVWATMATSIVGAWVLNLLAAVLLLRQRLPDPAFAWGLRLGVLVAGVGMALAFLMTDPTPGQEAAAAAGRGELPAEVPDRAGNDAPAATDGGSCP